MVDPGVGTARRPIGIRTARGDILIGPDNGVLMPAAAVLGGVAEARALENRDLMLPRTSSTFHGRDIFAPIAAHLAVGTPFEWIGSPIAAADLVPLAFPAPVARDGALETTVIFIDSFGNIRLAGVPADLEAAIGPLTPGRTLQIEFGAAAATPVGEAAPTSAPTSGPPPGVAHGATSAATPGATSAPTSARTEAIPWARTFGERPLGAALVYENSFGGLAIADNQGNAAARLGVEPERPVRIRPA
ncbi:MAG: SAM-dependent chlorinase/fluorinase [Chloroflexi bacterium]|nr:SAM-dependent chlorinase/fluorinase [Chloroflexota bacterium]